MPQTDNGARLLVDCLVRQGVEYVFGIPGAKIDAVFDALVDTSIKVIVCRHEQNAAFMAQAYGRLTGTPGVVVVTSGPGVSNLATGLLTATTEGDPIIAIGGAVNRGMKLKASHQSSDNIRLMSPVTKASTEITLPENIPEIIANAFRTATAPRSGAVFISVPQDVLHEKTVIKAMNAPAPELRGPANAQSIAKMTKLLEAAKLPVLLLGLEASRPENTAAIRQLLNKFSVPTIATYQAAGVVSHQLVDCYIGRVGLFKNQPGDQLIDMSDLVIAVGYDPVEYDPEIWNAAQTKKIVHVDYVPCSIGQHYQPALEVTGDIALSISELALQLGELKTPMLDTVKKLQQTILDKISGGKEITGPRVHPLRFIHELQQIMNDDVTVTCDIGSHYMWLARYFYSYQPRRLLFSNGQQTLGVALPWAMATKLVRPNETVISISGDGGFLFSAMELETAVREKISLIHCVWCDGKYDMVYEQEMLKYQRGSGIKIGHVDIVKFAESFGAFGFRVNHSDDLAGIFKKALACQGPVLIEIPIDYSHNRDMFLVVHDNAMH